MAKLTPLSDCSSNHKSACALQGIRAWLPGLHRCQPPPPLSVGIVRPRGGQNASNDGLHELLVQRLTREPAAEEERAHYRSDDLRCVLARRQFPPRNCT